MFPSSSSETMVGLEIVCDYMLPDNNLALAISGSIKEFGGWNIKEAKIADEKPENSGKWIVSLHLPANVKFEWKWVVVWRNTRIAFRWEERQNRVTEVGEHSFVCHAYWNSDPTYEFLPESPSMNTDKGDNWTTEDDKQLEKLADNETLEDKQSHKSVYFIASYIGYLVSWSLQSLKTKVMSFFYGVGGLFRRSNAHDHAD
ncbi:starch-binding domain-containing protein 1-like isoform X2 [Saccostrea cucullata]|uniref:starch-binding domain-containing protein 1-like isoform X2 n=1 Tax=Saccostrea cuccullata TaxID=36930 RepID=UPI002ED5ACB4